eukprot:TRINITY_DN4527_c0_g1_i5.p3 TRINITY_DN4527_c0_g1~~TRINITY_DN4527_c0_g1_i5.p3  ORF type:complete len:102 (+),score=20.94 TRINITY_DN4527_c0_g1_i5:127-432(+)
MCIRDRQRRDHEMELVTCGPNMPIEFWDCDQVEPVEQVEFPSKLYTLAISPSGNYLAAGSEQGQVVLFETNSKKFLGVYTCLLYTSPSPRDRQKSRMPSSA